jgi:hypothetical protein
MLTIFHYEFGSFVTQDNYEGLKEYLEETYGTNYEMESIDCLSVFISEDFSVSEVRFDQES